MTLQDLYSRNHAFIWIDAICINQSDQRERGEQILYMFTIYGKADEVMVWLGAEA